MICETIRKGMECAFMTAKGCGYNNGLCHEVVDQCKGCNRSTEIETGWYCSACAEPSLKWKTGNCNLATHVSATTTANKQKINPLKASKTARK